MSESRQSRRQTIIKEAQQRAVQKLQEMHEERARKIQELDEEFLEDLKQIEESARQRLIRLSEELLKLPLSSSTDVIIDQIRQEETRSRLLTEQYKTMADAALHEFQRALREYL
jgi:hypothetical protein